MKTITSALAAALIASASFAGAALAADGDYYDGVQPGQKAEVQHQIQRAHQSGSYGYTGSISRAAGWDFAAGDTVVNSGDYYDGASRPN
jgi:uncharacterized cupredoxin-like copper-binding protein